MFKTLLDDIFIVFQKADQETQILTETTLPVDFYELDANNIVSSYVEYMKGNSSPKTTSISEKYDRKQYSTLYELYHDIKAVASSRIQKYKVG